MRIPNLESMIHEVEQDITYTLCENCLLYLYEHKIISKGVRETNEDYVLLLVCPMLNNLHDNRTPYLLFKSKLMTHADALYFAHCNDQYVYTPQQGG